MGTPHTDRLYKMESQHTGALEDSYRHLASVSQSLTQIATDNREVAADLGLEYATARVARASLDRLARRMLTQADTLKQIVKPSVDVLSAGIGARDESVEIQAELSKLSETIDRAEEFANAMPTPEVAVATERLQAQHQAAHAKIDSLAKTSLSKFNKRTLTTIDGFPLRDQASVGHAGRSSAGGQAGHNLATGSKTGLPTRSAAAWGASVDTSLGGPGRHAEHHDSLGIDASSDSGSASGSGGEGASLQASHYAPPSSGTVASPGSSGSPTGTVGHSPTVRSPLASAVAITGGAGMAGYRAYQAAHVARAIQTPAARASVVRAAGVVPSASSFLSAQGIIRSVTTAVHTPTGSAGRPADAVRGGAIGVARPTSAASGRPAGIVRRAITAMHTPATPGRSASIVRGTTAAVRTQMTSLALTGQLGGRAPVRDSGARVLTGRRTPTANRTGSSQRADSSRGADASRGAGSSPHEELAARSTSPVERTPIGQTGRSGATRATAPSRRQNSSNGLSQSGPHQTEAGNAPRSGLRGTRNGSSSQALSGLTSGPNKKNKRRRGGKTPPSVSPYEDDRTVTFLKTGHREEDNGAQPR